MRYFDCHLHLGSSDDAGFTRFLAYVGTRSDLVGGNLVINTPEEASVVEKRLAELPPHIKIVPPLPLEFDVPASLTTSGWWKVHPALHQVDRGRIPEVVRLVSSRPTTAGVMVHHFPWGDRLEHNTGLELVIELARAFPKMPIVATHGGGYESWPLRAHTARLGNVYYDFSVSFAIYKGTDHVRVWTQYVQKRRNRILFGSDWPSADAEPQLDEAVRLAAEAGVGADELERQLLENSNSLWPRSPRT
jgi:predicted TIM-barrel fold metal-dependent hydrolase